jgi:putative pyruvate formate lyase activating enzyme
MIDHFMPAYVRLLKSGELAERARLASERLETCQCCPRRCGAKRLDSGQNATCQTGELAVVASYGPHLGEEDPLRGYRGSGTIFFSWCNLRCVFCQNYDISHFGRGRPTFPEELAAMMLELEADGCHNINLVSPSHVVPQILTALLIAAQAGLRIPLVYNSGGYDAIETLQLLDGVVDIYMPDMKYADPHIGRRLSGVPDYPAVNQQAVREMHRQVGDLIMDQRGIAQRGLLIRHLVLPNRLAGSGGLTSDNSGYSRSKS